MKYADGLEPGEEASPLVLGRTTTHNRESQTYVVGIRGPAVWHDAAGGYAFAQEDHDSKTKGTSVQRRKLIRMFNTLNPLSKRKLKEGTSV